VRRHRAAAGVVELPRAQQPGLEKLNVMEWDDCVAALRRCCASREWAEQMAAMEPFEDVPALLRWADRIWWRLDEAAWREAFSAHPKIGEQRGGAWSASEQAAAGQAQASTRDVLTAAQASYAEKFGFNLSRVRERA